MLPPPANGAGPAQGLAAARPTPAPPGPGGPAGGGPPPELMQAAMALIKQAVQQFGPEIIIVLKQILATAPGSAPTGAGAPPPSGAKGGM